jgi:hypothetical protein
VRDVWRSQVGGLPIVNVSVFVGEVRNPASVSSLIFSLPRRASDTAADDTPAKAARSAIVTGRTLRSLRLRSCVSIVQSFASGPSCALL